MDLSDRPAFTRRRFLHSGLTLASAAATVPWFINRSALALPAFAPGLSSIAGTPEDHILVVVQLSGGNDGLNTVVPFGMPEYYKARPGIGIAENAVIKLDKARGIGLHPQLTGLRSLHDNGLLTVVQGVGYPNPNRSHFKSMDIWHTADTTATGNGWLGRYFDAKCCGFGKGESGKAEPTGPEAGLIKNTGRETGATQPGIAIGRTAPLALEGQRVKPIAFETEDLFRWIGQDVHPALHEPYMRLESREAPATTAAESNAAFLMRTAMDAQVSSELIRKAVRLKPLTPYPQNNDLAQQLAMVGSMIRAGLPTRVYYVSLGGFDTHAGQGGAQGGHANLLNRFASAVQAFYADLKAQGNDGRVLTMSFSEFGRRVGQNASQGTDHGTAAPMFLMGPMVKPGVVGEHPSLTDLDDGDLKYRIDFRTVYAAILSKWLGADAKAILEGTFKPADVIREA